MRETTTRKKKKIKLNNNKDFIIINKNIKRNVMFIMVNVYNLLISFN